MYLLGQTFALKILTVHPDDFWGGGREFWYLDHTSDFKQIWFSQMASNRNDKVYVLKKIN